MSRRTAWSPRHLLVLLSAGLAVAVYLVWWTTYASIHFEDRWRQAPLGGSARVQGADLTLLQLQAADELTDIGGRAPAVPPAGAVWIVAKVVVTVHRDPKGFFCPDTLLGTRGQQWSTEIFASVSRADPVCSPDEIEVGIPYRFELLFQVPGRDVGQVAGLLLTDPSSAGRKVVLRPPG